MKTVLVLTEGRDIGWLRSGLFSYLRENKLKPLYQSREHLTFQNSRVIFFDALNMNREVFLRRYTGKDNVFVFSVNKYDTEEMLKVFKDVKYYDWSINIVDLIATIFSKQSSVYYKVNHGHMKIEEFNLFDWQVTRDHFANKSDAEAVLVKYTKDRKSQYERQLSNAKSEIERCDKVLNQLQPSDVVYKKSTDVEEVQLLRRAFATLDFRFIRKDTKGREILNIPIQLSVFNRSAQSEIDEMFSLYKIDESLRFKIAEVTANMPELKRK